MCWRRGINSLDPSPPEPVSETGCQPLPLPYSNSLERNGTLHDNTAQTSAYIQYEPHLLFSRYGLVPSGTPHPVLTSDSESLCLHLSLHVLQCSPKPKPWGLLHRFAPNPTHAKSSLLSILLSSWVGGFAGLGDWSKGQGIWDVAINVVSLPCLMSIFSMYPHLFMCWLGLP